MSKSLDLVKCYMSYWGWSAGGEPGSVKRDADNKVIARHGDSTWKDDIELTCTALTHLMDRVSDPNEPRH